MMSGYWPAVSGSKALETHLDTVANNLANVDTVGFKRDEPTFKNYLDSAQSPTMAEGVPDVKGSPGQLYPLDGKGAEGVRVTGTYTDHRIGKLFKTGNALDMALTGPGFFEVATPQGVLLTRAGNFKLDSNARLVTSDGYPVLGPDAGQAQGATDGEFDFKAVATARGINLSGAQGSITVADDGTISSQGQILGRIGMKQISDPRMLTKEAGVFFKAPASATRPAQGLQIEQGFLESSNVNPMKELTEMIRINRAFDAAQKAVKTMSDIQGKAVSELPRL